MGKKIEDKNTYQFPGVFQSQCLYYIPDCTKLPQYVQGKPHFIWDDIQLSKGKLNKDGQIDVDIDGEKVQLIYRSSPCNGVKKCSTTGYDYIIPVREKQPCKDHPSSKLVKSEGFPVYIIRIAYLYPRDYENDGRR